MKNKFFTIGIKNDERRMIFNLTEILVSVIDDHLKKYGVDMTKEIIQLLNEK